jgi:NADPH-dependent glutamate synthase beta subunit-like oxidoreductase
MAVSKEPLNTHTEEENDANKYPKQPSQRKKVVVVGLGMVGVAFM